MISQVQISLDIKLVLKKKFTRKSICVYIYHQLVNPSNNKIAKYVWVPSSELNFSHFPDGIIASLMVLST